MFSSPMGPLHLIFSMYPELFGLVLYPGFIRSFVLFPSSVTNVGGLSNLLKASFFFSAFQIEGGLAPLSLLLVLVLLSVVIFLSKIKN